LASGIYLLNDIIDYKEDRNHPIKKLRPIASGRLQISRALWLSLVLFAAGMCCSLFVNWQFSIVVLTYVGLSILYSCYVKHIVILDVLLLSSFYIIRVLAGGLAINVQVSDWIIICTFMLAIFMGFGKRRHEITLLKKDALVHRKVLSEYSTYFLDQIIAVVTPSTVIAYLLYTMSPETINRFNTRLLPITLPFVLYGIFRYLYLVHQKEDGGDPTTIMLTDKPLIITVVCWIAVVLAIIYVG
jgi:4-hydroxybenzoate polyprenyltransferase